MTSNLLGNTSEEALVLAEGSNRHPVAARTGSHSISDCNVLRSRLNGDSIVTVENRETIDQNIRGTVDTISSGLEHCEKMTHATSKPSVLNGKPPVVSASITVSLMV